MSKDKEQPKQEDKAKEATSRPKMSFGKMVEKAANTPKLNPKKAPPK